MGFLLFRFPSLSCASPGPWLLGAALACQSAPRELALSDPERAILVREPRVALAREALELADLAALDLALPAPGAVLAPAEDSYWHVAAFAYAPEVRAARAAARVALAVESGAGSAGPIALEVTDHDLESGADPLVEVAASFDLLGWLGLGRAAAERAGARAEALAAIGELQASVWRAPFEVDRARVRLAAARARVSALARVHAEATEDSARIALLTRHGRVAPALAELAAGSLHQLLSELAGERERERVRAVELALAAGLAPDHAALSAVEEELALRFLERARAAQSLAANDPADHPRVAQARLVLALSEARVRRAARAVWPELVLGPHLGFREGLGGGGVGVGGLVQIAWSVPARWRSELAAAEEERARALEAYEEAWLSQAAAVAVARAQLETGLARFDEHTARFAGSTENAWRATQARLRVEQADLELWTRALSERTAGVLALADQAEAVALAALDWLEARGPAPRSAP